MATTPTDLRAAVLRCVADLHPERLTGAQAAAAVAEFATIEKAAATARVFAALRVAKTDAWCGQGHATAIDWLAAAAGITVREAAAQLGTARKAEKLPKTKERMRAGKLSPTQAGAVADGASADPGAEDSLLDAAANGTTADLKAKAAKAKAAATDSATREKRIRAERTLRTRTDDEGAFCLWLRGPATDGARFLAMLRPFQEHAFRHGRTDGTRDTFDNRSYDAFFTLLAYLQHHTGTAPTTNPTPPAAGGAAPAPPALTSDDSPSGDDTPSSPPPQPPPSPPQPGPPTPPGSSGPTGPPGASGPAGSTGPPVAPLPVPAKVPGGNNTKVIVLVDHTALLRGHTTAGETCEIAGLGPISARTARDILATDPFLAVVVRKGRDVVNVAHHGRGLDAHQRTAIEATGLRCTNLACNRTIAIQIDHRTPYATNPETALSNQDPLCPDCHRRKTHHRWHLEPGTGPRRLLPPTTPHDADPNRPDTVGRPSEADAPDPTRRPTGGAHRGDQIDRAAEQQIEQPSLC